MDVRTNLMERQESVFTKEHIDRILAEDRQADASGQLGVCSLEPLLKESGALDDKGSHYGPLAQAAASYYVRQRMDDINERAYQLRKSGKRVGFCPANTMGRLANQMANIDYDLSQRCGSYTAVTDRGTEEMMRKTGHLDYYDYALQGSPVRFPADTRQFAGMDLGYPSRTMDSVMNDVKLGGLTYEQYFHGQKLYMQDRFSELFSAVTQQKSGSVGEWHEKAKLFEEVYSASEIAKAAGFGDAGPASTNEDLAKALFGNSMSVQLDKMNYFAYAKDRAMSKQNGVQGNREIKNVPDFMKSGNSPELKPIGFDGYDF